MESMNTTQSSQEASRKFLGARLIAFVAIAFLLPAVSLFAAAGHLDWIWAWLLLGVWCGIGIGSRLVMLIVDPDVLVERERSLHADNTKPWDRVLMPVVGLLLPLFTLN